MTQYKLPAIFAVIALVAATGTLSELNGLSTSSTSLGKTSEGLKMLGHVEIVAKDSSGNIKAYRQTDNIVTNVGKSCVGVRLFGGNGSQSTGDNTACGGSTQTAKFSWIGLGTSTQAEAATDTALITPFENRGAATTGLINGTNTYNTIQRTLLANGTGTISESGLFDASSGGHMFARKQFTGIGLNSLDTLTVTWRITYS
jgi:hypothetical protein